MWKPATSSLSASGRSNGARFVSAIPAMRKIDERRPLRPDVPVGHELEDVLYLLENRDAVEERDVADRSGLLGDDVHRRESSRHESDRHERQPERDLVGDHLRGGADSSEQRVLRSRCPAGKHHSVNAERSHREEVKEADVEVAHDQPDAAVADRYAGPRWEPRQRPGTRAPWPLPARWRRSTCRRALGRKSSLKKSLIPSASVWRIPIRPPSVRPDSRLHVGDDLSLGPYNDKRHQQKGKERAHHLDDRDDDVDADEVNEPVHGLLTFTVGFGPVISLLARSPF